MTQIVLIILKCCGVLNCGWGLILLPLWCYLVLIAVYTVICIVRLKKG
jgi:hypothetical protein